MWSRAFRHHFSFPGFSEWWLASKLAQRLPPHLAEAIEQAGTRIRIFLVAAAVMSAIPAQTRVSWRNGRLSQQRFWSSGLRAQAFAPAEVLAVTCM